MDPQTLKALRRSSGLTQAELAERLEIDRTTVTRIERGERRIDVSLLERWATVCGAHVSVAQVPAVSDLPRRVAALSAEDQDLVRAVLDALSSLSPDNRAALRAVLGAWTVKKM